MKGIYLTKEGKKESVFIDLEDLRSEYESTYLNYWNKSNPMSFEKWLKKEKDIVIVKKSIKNT